MKYLLPILALVLSTSGRVAKREAEPAQLFERGDNTTVQADWNQPPPSSCPPEQTKTVVETCYVTTTQKEKYGYIP